MSVFYLIFVLTTSESIFLFRTMPDGDKIHAKLPGPYQDGYKRLCEGQNPADVAREFEKGLKKSLKHHGNDPVECIENISKVVQERLTGPLFDDLATQKTILESVEELARNEIGNKRVGGIVGKACKQVLIELMSRATYDPQDFPNLVHEQYVRYVFEDSTSRLHHTPYHDLGVEHEEIETRMQAVLPEMKDPIRSFAKQLRNSGSVENLRISRKERQAPVNLADNLLEI